MNRQSVVAAVVVVGVVVGGALLLKANTAATPSAGRLVRAEGESSSPAARPVPRFVDVGTTTCAPCRVMLGVMGELEQRYPGEMVVEFVDTQERPAEGRRLGVRIIPTQIFYAPDGRELFRHTGVYRVEEIVAKWAELGFSMTPTGER